MWYETFFCCQCNTSLAMFIFQCVNFMKTALHRQEIAWGHQDSCLLFKVIRNSGWSYLVLNHASLPLHCVPYNLNVTSSSQKAARYIIEDTVLSNYIKVLLMLRQQSLIEMTITQTFTHCNELRSYTHNENRTVKKLGSLKIDFQAMTLTVWNQVSQSLYAFTLQF